VERQRLALLAEERARRARIEKVKSEELLRQLDAWRQAADVRAYCEALAQRLANAGDVQTADVEAAREWLAWALKFVERLDPLLGFPQAPADEPSWDRFRSPKHF
jgi:hypothetical protein